MNGFEFMDKHSRAEITNATLLADLLSTARLAKRDTVDIENKNAKLRRLVHTRSLQTWLACMDDVNADMGTTVLPARGNKLRPHR